MATSEIGLTFVVGAVNQAKQAMDSVAHDLGDVEDASSDTAKALEDLRGEVADLGDKVDANGQTLDQMAGQINEIAEAGGNAEQALRGISDIATFMEEQLGLSLGPLKESTAALADLGGGIEGVLKGGPAFVAQLKAIPGSIVPAVTATWAYVSALVAQAAAFIAANAPLIALVAGLALLAAGIVLLVRHWDTVVAAVPALGVALEVVKKAFDAITTAAGNVLAWLQANWKTVAVILAGPFAPLVALATDAFGVRSALEGAFTAAKAFVAQNWPEIAAIISGPFFPLVALATDAFGVRSALEGALSSAKDFVSDRVDEIVGFFTALPGRILETLTSVLDAGKQIGTSMRDGIISGLSTIAEKVGDITGALIDALKGAWNAMIDWADRNFKLSFTVGAFGVEKTISIDPDLSGFKLASGLWEVPGPRGAGDVFPALLAPGEMVLPERIADHVRGGGMGGNTFIAHINIAGDATEETIARLEPALDGWFDRRMEREHGVLALQWGAI